LRGRVSTPSGDAYFLVYAADRELLAPEPDHGRALWTSRMWPGAVLVDGEVAWRRKDATRRYRTVVPSLTRRAERSRAEASLPLPGIVRAIVAR
jgi:hypothetical protein